MSFSLSHSITSHVFFIFLDLIQNETCSGVLQSLLYVLGKVHSKEYKALVKYLVDEVFPQEFDASHFDSEPFCRILEVILSLRESSPKLHQKLIEKYFKGNIKTLACHPGANFAIQRLILSFDEKDAVRLSVSFRPFQRVYKRDFIPV